ncbi:ribosomal-protein-alanine N-acetyltransferase [Bacillus sp. THAF10]|uniref:GNAT family N-acetyltransferase n=1 Tax=Bacillus sp. THAF10 TaxID=2587848 RepID=UPI0012696867|nr:GNAT family N-acetyltransferase [Bacillus sp. THAF10]QFT88001.1 ribosomal-protein-alanine N-acetyltransferase [Bacillus sp. THAF10]
MEIRVLGKEDAKQYRELRLEGLKGVPEAFSSSFDEESKMDVAAFASRFGAAHVFTFGAFIEQKLAGTVTLICETKIKIKHRSHIVAMYVSDEFRKQGVGKMLMETAIHRASEQEGVEQVLLTVNASNEPAKKLYQSLGFTTFGVDVRALKVGNTYYDEEMMVLAL